mgnify:CR=1 FL=1
MPNDKCQIKLKTLSEGQSLVEVVMTISVIVLVLVGLISAVTVGLANAQFARNKAQATKYSQEAVEWLRSQRDAGWTSFYNRSSASGSVYCLNTFTFTGTSGTCGASSYISDQFNLFKREVTLTQFSNRVSIAVQVYWLNGNRTSDVTVNSYLTQWR